MSEKHTSIGALKKPHGLTGELKVHIQETYLEDFLSAKVLFLKMDGKLIPYFVENIRVGSAIIVKVEDINSKEKALKLASKELFLQTDKLIPDSEKTLIVEGLEYEPYVGFQLEDITLGTIGPIKRVEEFPQQEIAIVLYQEKEVMVPMNEHFIIEIDEAAKVVKVDLPEGLLDV